MMYFSSLFFSRVKMADDKLWCICKYKDVLSLQFTFASAIVEQVNWNCSGYNFLVVETNKAIVFLEETNAPSKSY